jgi:uncharacterized protein (DUF983 family)
VLAKSSASALCAPSFFLARVAFDDPPDEETSHGGDEHGEHLPQRDRFDELQENAHRRNGQTDELQQSTKSAHRAWLRGSVAWENTRIAYHKRRPPNDASGDSARKQFSMTSRKSYWTVMSRAWRLRCPRCGEGKLFATWLRMHAECPHCQLRFEREPGFFLGSIYVNYGLTAMLVIVLYLGLFFWARVSGQTAVVIAAAFSVLFPLWFFRYARSLWLGFDQYWDPR